MNKELTPLKALYDLYVRARIYCPTDEISIVVDEWHIIETTLKNYKELTNKPAILYGRTYGRTKKLIDTICKNYKEVKITNLEDEKKLKALEVIKEKRVCIELLLDTNTLQEYNDMCIYHKSHGGSSYKCLPLTQEEFELLKEVLKGDN